MNIQKVRWFSTYHVHNRVATHFQRGRCFLLGDAAHIHSPIGGQGMNAAIGDAVNLAWKLSAVLNGRISNKILTTYEIERISFAKTLLYTTDLIFRITTSCSVWGSLFRAYILPIAFSVLARLKPVLRLMFRLLSQTRVNYRESPLSEGLAGSARAGDRLPWLKTDMQNNYEHLKLMDWHIQIYGTANENFSAVANFRGLPIYEFEWTKLAETRGFLKNAFYLIRPDGHIALVSAVQNPSVLKKYLNDWDIEHHQNMQTLTRAI